MIIILNINNTFGNIEKIISFTIDKKLFDKWKSYTKKESINSSKLIGKLLKKYLEEEEKQ